MGLRLVSGYGAGLQIIGGFIVGREADTSLISDRGRSAHRTHINALSIIGKRHPHRRLGPARPRPGEKLRIRVQGGPEVPNLRICYIAPTPEQSSGTWKPCLTSRPLRGCKPEGIDGSRVEEMVLAGQIEEVARYCESNVLNTYRSGLSTSCSGEPSRPNSLFGVRGKFVNSLRPERWLTLTCLRRSGL
jgi:Predicted 3'-5' exonuclease related to the exonuclease domain of PolB